MMMMMVMMVMERTYSQMLPLALSMYRPRPVYIVMFVFAYSGRVESRSWSAVQSHTFSMYSPVADSVMCIDMNAAVQDDDEEAFELLLLFCASEDDVVFQPEGAVAFRKECCFRDDVVETMVLLSKSVALKPEDADADASLLTGAGQSAFCSFDPANPPIRV